MLPSSCSIRCRAGRHSRAEVHEEQIAFSRTAWAACQLLKGWWFLLIWSTEDTFLFSPHGFQEQSSSTFTRILMSLSTHNIWCPLDHYCHHILDQNWQFSIRPEPSLCICKTEHGFSVSPRPGLIWCAEQVVFVTPSLSLHLCYHYPGFAGKGIFYFLLGHYSRWVYRGRCSKMRNRVEKVF